MISLSAADIAADLFFSLPAFSPLSVEEEAGVADLNTFGRLGGFALRGFTTGFKGFILNPVGAVGAAATVGFIDNDSTTFSVFSSRFKPSSTPDCVDGPAPLVVSAAARSICSAINCRSRCSSEIVALSFA